VLFFHNYDQEKELEENMDQGIQGYMAISSISLSFYK
jgi:hypothetical protein